MLGLPCSFFSARYDSAVSTPSYTEEVLISHNEREGSRTSIAAASSAFATAPADAGGAVAAAGDGAAGGAYVAFCLLHSSFRLLYSLRLCNLVCVYISCAVEVSYDGLLDCWCKSHVYLQPSLAT